MANIEKISSINVMFDDGALMPTCKNTLDVGYYLLTPNDFVLESNENIIIDTGVHFQIPVGWYGELRGCDDLYIKHNIVCFGGIVHGNFVDSVKVKIYNFGDYTYEFQRGDKIAQIIFIPYVRPRLLQVYYPELMEV